MKREPPSHADDTRATAERLLDAAERLFGQLGYDGVGMRALADEARVNLGAATYHFGSKEALYIETFMRRFRPVEAERLQRLAHAEAEARAGGTPLTVERIVDCMVRPAYQLGLEHPNFHTFLARSLFLPPPFLHEAICSELEPHIQVFITALRRCLPKVEEDLIRLRYMFGMGAMLMFCVNTRTPVPIPSPILDECVLRELIDFIAAGMGSHPKVAAKERPAIPWPPKALRR